jgi:hypothetical protein
MLIGKPQFYIKHWFIFVSLKTPLSFSHHLVVCCLLFYILNFSRTSTLYIKLDQVWMVLFLNCVLYLCSSSNQSYINNCTLVHVCFPKGSLKLFPSLGVCRLLFYILNFSRTTKSNWTKFEWSSSKIMSCDLVHPQSKNDCLRLVEKVEIY